MHQPDPPEVARRLAEAYNRRDLDGIVSMYSEGAVWDMSELGVGVLRGRDAIRHFLEDWLGNYEEFEFALEEVHDLGHGVAGPWCSRGAAREAAAASMNSGTETAPSQTMG